MPPAQGHTGSTGAVQEAEGMREKDEHEVFIGRNG